MTADFGNIARDRYIIGQYAYWAGDYDFAQQCYAAAARRDVTATGGPIRREHDDALIENLGGPDDLLAYVADRREQRIAERHLAFNTLVRSLPADARDLVPQPLILETARLRGAVWRLGTRDFEMRAYVSKMDYGKLVVSRAKEIADQRVVQERRQIAPAEPLYSTPVYEWEVTGNPFLTIVVTRLAFIEVTAFWSAKRLPRSFSPIQERLQSVLDELSQ